MRAWALAAMLLVLSGCLGDAPSLETARPTTVAADVASGAPNASVDVPPVHPVGRAWTFTGIQQYNPDTQIVVVVAQASAEGYLFAGATEDDVHYDAVWGNPLFGVHGRDMQRGDYWRWFDFPLHDGKTWAVSSQLNATAAWGTIRTPLGDEPGFTISGENERMQMKWEYSPTLGQLVSVTTKTQAGLTLDDYRLTKVEDGRAWTWYERGEISAAWNPHEPTLFEVPEGYDALLVSAGGRDGARTSVQGPGGASWQTDFPTGESWKHATLPATPGQWSAAVVGRPDVEDAPPVDVPYPVGWAHTQIAPVKWLRSG